ncbi:hypothetical protein PINS_up008704 [Pythium insidiosum]|nr:hypothetical protein PINS_up008704 [Pythium insidiosum]
MEQVLARLREYETRNEEQATRYRDAPAPSLLEDVTLHEYQLEGMRWVLSRLAHGINPILGDEMGLGKTLQMIALVASLLEHDAAVTDHQQTKANVQRFLVVAPLSVVPNWVEQFGSFAPAIDVRMYAGQKDERKALQAEIKAVPNDSPLVVVTSYDILLIDTDFFASITWRLRVLDEGHRLKNSQSKLHGLLKTRVAAQHTVLLSGTPIQNELKELFALLSFLNPDVFNDQRTFEAVFKPYFSAKSQQLSASGAAQRSSVVSSAEELMRQILAPILLLRTVKDVNSAFTLPPISEIVVHTPMAPMQRAYYKEVVARNSDAINSANNARGSRIALINILPQLRKACNHPYLFPGAEPEPFYEGSHLYENSGKLYVLHHILPRLRADGHCVLLFSQSTGFLDIMQDYLTYEGFSYERVDGSVRGKERWQAIDRFRSSPDTFVFLISTRSGGVGLNLQRADTVIFVDSDYNPQADLQAVARAYRLGQTSQFTLSIEEIIYRRALKKMHMADRIRECARDTVSASDEMSDAGSGAGNVDNDDGSKSSLVELIQFGLHKLLDGDSEDGPDGLVAPLDEDYVRHILTRKTLNEREAVNRKGDDLETAAGDVQEDNMYYFDGEDYSTSDARAKDEVSLQQLLLGGEPNFAKGKTTRRKRYDGEEDIASSEGEFDPEQAAIDAAELARQREARRQQQLEKKLAKWAKNGYISMAIEEEHDVSTSSRVIGSSFRRGIPVRGSSEVSRGCARWSRDNTKAAGLNGDLKLGQAHLIHLPQDVASRDTYVCLLVVQGFVSTAKGKKRQRTAAGIRQGKSTMFRLHALERALQTLASRALRLQASVHMPRIGYGTPQFNWYAVERIIKRQLSDANVPVSIYYFSRRPPPR